MNAETVQDLYPLSPMQKGMLFHTLLDPEAGDYLAQVTCLLEGTLDPERFRRAWVASVRRHDALRTAFVWEGLEEPLQVVLPEAELPLEVADWRGLDAGEASLRLEALLADDRERGFDLARPPLMRLHLARLDRALWRMTWSSHHLLFDGWSLPIVLREVFEHYSSDGLADAPAPRPYRDYLAWLQERDVGAARAYWSQHLAGFRSPTPLPGARRPAASRVDWRDQFLHLPPESTEHLASFARESGLTLATLLQGAWALLLARTTGEEEVVFGVTRSGRPAELQGVESMVGLFINTLPLRVPVPGDEPLLDWLQRVQERSAELAPHEWAPLADVTGWSELASGAALFETLLVVESYPLGEQGRLAEELALGEVRSLERTNYPLNLIATPGRSLELRLAFDAARVEPAIAERLLAGVAGLLRGIVERPRARLAERTPLCEHDRRLQLEDWGRGGEPGADPACVHDLFRARVERHPDAVAATCGDGSWTYAELAGEARRLAARLRGQGLGPEDLVAVCVDRTEHLPIAILAIAECGAAWTTLDPGYPPDRLARQLVGARCAALVGARQHLDRLHDLAEERDDLELPPVRAALDGPAGDGDTGDRLATAAQSDPGAPADPESLAYVIYTSGSTGEPKGIEVPHRGLASLAHATARAADLGPGRRVAQLSSVGFDVCVLEVLGALLSGSTLRLPGVSPPPPGPELVRDLRAARVDTLMLSPAVLRELEPEKLPDLRTLVVGGETCTADLAALWSDRRLVHAYGPAEATVTAVQNESVSADAPPTLGRPLPGVRAYVLGPDLEPLPVGAVGELCLGGLGVARGYRGDPARTAARFLPDPFAQQAGARMLRTGDRARWVPDRRGGAELEFAGREDGRLKVRGVRVEPGEIEAALLAHADVRQAAVDAVDERSLAAWFVARAGARPRPAELRGFLADRLPAALVPSHLVPLEALPLTPHGKVDRDALPRPATNGERVPAPPRGPLETWLVERWVEVLDLDAAGADDDFFERGGDSLRAMQLVARLRDALGIDLPLRALFRAPTPAELARCIERLDPDALERMDAGARDVSGLPPIVACPEAGPQPLSHGQERLWFLDRYEPGSPQYHVPAAVRLRGELDAEALERALNGVVARHRVLRTRFEEGPEGPLQVVEESTCLSLERQDLRDGDADLAGRRERARQLATAEARRPFDLTRAPLLRARLLTVDEREHVLALVFHHVVADGWSVGIFARELSALYREASRGEPAGLPEIPIQVGDVAAWQREPRVAAHLDGQLAAWREELRGAPTALELPTDRPRSPLQSFRGRSVELPLEADVARKLAELGRATGTTTFTVLLTAFGVWLSRLAGQPEVLVGTPVAGRSRSEMEPLIGFFVNTLPLRLDLGGAPSFRDALARAHERVLFAWAHQDVPFERLVEELVTTRDRARPPLVQTLLVFQNLPPAEIELHDVESRVVEVDTGTSKFDLSLLVDGAREGGELRLTLEFNTDLFEASTASAWLESFAELCRSVAARPDRAVSELGLLPHAEREHLLEVWGSAPWEHPRDATLHGLFEQRAARAPDATALVFGGETMSYGELERRAELLARHLRGLGIGPEVPVAVGCERSFELIVALTGVLKAGGSYVPLDPLYPRERRDWMLADCGAPLLITQASLAKEFPEPGAGGPARRILLDAEWETIAAAGPGAPSAPVDPGALAYRMYTSGSTGTPKCVGVSHRAVVRLLAGRPFVKLDADEVVLQMVSSAFDVSVFEIWGALLSGARLEVFPPHVPSLAELGAFVRERGVTTLWLTSGLFHLMVDERLEDLVGVRQLLAGGEAVSAPHVARTLAALPDCSVVDGYGPTEVTCFTCTHTLHAGDEVPPAMPIGRPINGTRVYVLDAALEPVPRGVWGELWAAGDGLARGYTNDARLTAERFLPDPFDDRPGARMYRIGDRARWRPDGTLDFGGRVDRQVKVRGFRIELGEVEAALNEHPDVQRSVVELRGDQEGAHTVAWIVADREPGLEELRAFLRGKLPEAAVPTCILTLDALPLTPNGKVDRRALPPPESAPRSSRATSRPLSPLEQVIAGQWEELLGVRSAGVDDDFFELGGHSLIATRLVARLREALGVELPLQRVFEHSTLAGLARSVEDTRRADTAAPAAAPIERSRRDAPIPLTFAQERLWFLERWSPGNPVHHTPLVLDVGGDLDVDALRAGLERVVERHEILRTRFPEHEGRPHQVILPPGRLDLPLDDLSARVGAEQADELERLRVAELRRPFDLERGPVLRARLVRCGPERHVLLVVLHHIVSDGWSLSLLMRELAETYRAAREGVPAQLEELPIQFADYALWQARELDEEQLERELDWWRGELGEAPRRLELGSLRAAADAQGAIGERPGDGLCAELPPDLYSALEALARGEGATPFMVLLAAFQAVLAGAAGREDVIIGAPIARRTRAETERLMGPLVNLLALRGDLTGDPTLRELIARVRHTTLGAFAHRDLPVERLAGLLRPDGDPRGGELFQVTFTMHEQVEDLELGGLELQRLAADAGGSFGELWLSVEPRADRSAEVYWHYDAGLFTRGEIERLHGAWRRALEAAVADPGRRLSDLPRLAESERRLLLEEWGRAPATHPRDATVHGLWRRRVERAPDAPAVACGERALDAGELDRRANRLAHHLRSLGVGPDVVVGVLLERSIELVVAQLGVLAAGGAYLPLDPDWPVERSLDALLEGGATLLVSREELADELPSLETTVGARFVALDTDAAAIAAREDTAPDSGAGPENLAYVMFTSGSTGRPKGVGVPHRAVVRLVAGQSFARLEDDEVVAHFAPAAFDASTFEVWGALLSGARLEVVPAGRPSLLELGAFLRERGVTTTWLTAGLFHQMVDERLEDLAGLRQLLAGGEALSADHVRRALEAHPGLVVIDGYGPTECTTFSATHAMRAGDGVPDSVPIGRPINATTLRVLDGRQRLLPRGAWGELWIGGDGLARGYLNDARGTAERFRPEPHGDAPGARAYRSGDRVRWRDDGTLEFGGRLDRQVKLRGHRIEPGEVEAALRAHSALRDAVVGVREVAGDRRLVAWVVGEPAPGAEALRAYLRARLPEPLVPSHVVALEELPLTANGKLDRDALPDPLDEAAPHAFVPRPCTPTEELVAGQWQELLGVGSVGPEDDFFELGGHSLLATRLVSRLRELFDVELPLQTIFEHPRLGELAPEVERCRGDARAEAGEPIRRVDRDGELPLSFAQQRLWLLQRLDPLSAAYHVPFSLDLVGELDAEALRWALELLIARHEILRTSFPEHDGRPRQVIAEPSTLSLPVEDLTGHDDTEREAALRRLTEDLARRPFDIENGPLLRARLVRRGARDHRLLLCLHHAVCDAWSLGVLTCEISELYAARIGGGGSPLGELPLQAADHAAWQRASLSGSRLVDEIGWWRERLDGAPRRLDLVPAPRRREAAGPRQGRVHLSRIEPDLARDAERLARQEGVTPFMLFLGVFQVLLGRLASTDDVVVASPIAGREHRELEGLIGFLVNTLLLRTDLSGRPTFRELLARVREVALGAYDHQELPFDRLVEELMPGTDREPFQVMFAVQNAPPAELALPGLEVRARELETGEARCDLVLALERGEDGAWIAAWDHDVDRLGAERVRALDEAWRRLLGELVADPDARPADLALLSHDGAAEEVVLARGPRTPFPREAGLWELYRRAAAADPEQPAVVGRGFELSHGKLLARAERLAATLHARGLGGEELVGLCAGRSDHLALGALAALRAGGAYVPVDPLAPLAHARSLLEDCAVRFVLCTRDDLERLRALGLECIDLESIPLGGDPPPDRGRGDSLAYVMHTSGSTGRPKGVPVTQRAVARLVLGADYVELGPGHRVARINDPTFDAVTFELWGALLGGATLVDIEREDALRPEGLAARLREDGVTHLVLTTALLRQVVRERPDAFATLDTLLFGGETCDPDDLRRLRAAGAPRHLVHVYGPTETTTFATSHEVTELDSEASSVPIGTPVAHTDVHVLDGELRPLPRGFAGELWIGGDGVARGYLGDPRRTAECFVPDPCSSEPGARIYRTGDRALRDALGRIEFLGRTDAQIKHRGRRIEPGEVESALRELAGVRDAVVDLHHVGEEGPRLVAWVVTEPGAAASDTELHDALSARLPEPLVPTHFVRIGHVPVHRRGKIDREALPDPVALREGDRPRTEPPRGQLEERIAAIWCEVLGLERVGRDEGFFELGGHSLLAARIAARVSKALGARLPLRAVFEAPTIRGLAARAAGLRTGTAEPGPGSGTGPREGPLSFAQDRLWFLQNLQPESPAYNVPAAVRLRGPLDARAFERALVDLVQRHEALRTRFERRGDAVLQVAEGEPTLDLRHVDLSQLERPAAEEELRRRVRELAGEPFDLTRPGPWRTALVRLGPQEHAALFAIHHALCDGWSLGILVRELAALYAARARGEEPTLPAPALQPIDHARWQRGWLEGEDASAHLAWWRETLAGAPEVLDLPADRPRPPVQSFSGDAVRFALPAELVAGLRVMARDAGATPFMVFLAGFQALVHRLTGSTDLCLGTPVAGRDRVELEGTFGFLVDTLVLRTDLSGEPGFRELLARTRRTVLAAFDHRDVPFERVVEAVAPARDTSRSALVQVMFALHEDLVEPLRLPGMEIEPIEPDTATSKFDLTLSLHGEGGAISGELEFNTDLFDRPRIERLARDLERLLRSAVEDPERPITELRWIADEEAARLAVFSCSRSPAPAERPPVHLLVEGWAERTPEALALISAAGSLSYAELDRSANRLAHHLRALGIGPEDTVALNLDRSPELAVAALAVLKSGAAYLPLDLEHPLERSRFMLEDSGARAVLTLSRWADALEHEAREVLRLDALDLSELPASAPRGRIGPGSPAYVIYTSGSTGRPKGVVVPHAGLSNLIDWHVNEYGVGPGDRATLLAGSAFDASVWELWPYLARGAGVQVVPHEVRIDPARLIAWFAEQRITLTFLPTPVAESLIDEPWPADLALRAMLTGGDRLHRYPRAGLPFDLVNHYGPTEATVVTTFGVIPPDGGRAAPTIGRPIAGASVHVLDARLEPVPIGVPGELCIGGASLARGYSGRPATTATAFVPDAHGEVPGARLYRTGDLVSWSEDGTLRFLGRIDNQVKLRGYRIELGEIEARLQAEPEVEEAALVAGRTLGEATSLIAYLVRRPGAQVTHAELLRRLRDHLPEYMLPTDWVELEVLPKNSSGKVDRRALPRPEGRRPAQFGDASPPQSELERALVAIWRAVLEVEQVGCETNFFDLGGHSLLLLQVQTRLRDELDRDVPVLALFQHPTIRGLARFLEGGAEGEETSAGTRRARVRRDRRSRRRR